MKKHLTFLFLLTFAFFSHGQNIKFSYDNAGNQVKREICFCSREVNDSIVPRDSIKKYEELTEKDLTKDVLYDQISYYPNPVREELYVKWMNDEKGFVSTIELYSMNGQSLKSYSGLKGKETATIPFQKYPQGTYNLVLVYSNGDRKTLRIIKQ